MIVSTAAGDDDDTRRDWPFFTGAMSRYKKPAQHLGHDLCFVLPGQRHLDDVGATTLAFGPSKAGIIGGFDHLFMAGIGVDSLTGTIPTFVFALFQMTFAGITVALVLGSIVDRMKFSAWIVFSILWITFIYCPIAHWIWGRRLDGRDGVPLILPVATSYIFNAGVAGLVLSLVLGKTRRATARRPCSPSSITLTALGAALLWFGWVRFQCRQSVSRRRRGRIGVSGNQHVRRHGSAGVDVLRMDRHRQAHRPGHRLGCGRRIGGHHTGRRVCQSTGGTGDRHGFRGPSDISL